MEIPPTGPGRYDGFWWWSPTHGLLRLDYRWNVSIICRQGIDGCFQTTKTHIILEPPRFRSGHPNKRFNSDFAHVPFGERPPRIAGTAPA
jgi:hypothetical protein